MTPECRHGRADLEGVVFTEATETEVTEPLQGSVERSHLAETPRQAEVTGEVGNVDRGSLRMSGDLNPEASQTPRARRADDWQPATLYVGMRDRKADDTFIAILCERAHIYQ
jgi:hypothetical protein